MDKYEFNIKIDKMKKAVERKDYATAAKVADSLNWEKSTNAKVLMMIAQVYEKLERYSDARSALSVVYHRVPVGKRIVYKLTELSVKCGDLDEATDLYREFQEIAPNDPSKLILAYRISTAREESLEKRISILEAYRRREFDEKWSYELATLYQQAGKADECVALCDEIILWFGVGPYVDRAMNLKTTFTPLSPEQEEKRANRQYYEQQLNEVAAQSWKEAQDTDVPEIKSFQRPTQSPLTAPADKNAKITSDHIMALEQELAHSIQSNADDQMQPETNVWITDKPLSVDRVGEDVDGQYTLFRTVAEENGETGIPDQTRTFSFGSMLTKTRRLNSLQDLKLDEEASIAKAAETIEEAPAEDTAKTTPDAAEEVSEKTAENTAAELAAETVEEITEVVDETAEKITEEVIDAATVEETAETAVGNTTDENITEVTEVAEETTEQAVAETTEEAVAVPSEETAEAVADAVADDSEVDPADESFAATSADEPIDEEYLLLEEELEDLPTEKIHCHFVVFNDDEPRLAQIRDAHDLAHEISGLPTAPVARITVDKINHVGLSTTLKKLNGRDLLLENAGELAPVILEQILEAVEHPTCSAVILLADTEDGMDTLARKAPELFDLFAEDEDSDEDAIEFDLSALDKEFSDDEDDFDDGDSAGDHDDSDFEDSDDDDGDFEDHDDDDDFEDSDDDDESDEDEHKEESDSEYDLMPLSTDEFVAFLHRYAEENDCRFDEMGELALAARIDRMELTRTPMNRKTGRELLEKAIDKAERFSLRSIFVSKYDSEGYLVLKEKHFS